MESRIEIEIEIATEKIVGHAHILLHIVKRN